LRLRSIRVGIGGTAAGGLEGDETLAADNVWGIRAGGEYPDLIYTILYNLMHHRLPSIYARYLPPLSHALTLEFYLCLH